MVFSDNRDNNAVVDKCSMSSHANAAFRMEFLFFCNRDIIVCDRIGNILLLFFEMDCLYYETIKKEWRNEY